MREFFGLQAGAREAKRLGHQHAAGGFSRREGPFIELYCVVVVI